MSDNKVGTRLSYWIAHILSDAREREGIPTGDVARTLRVSDRTIQRLEVGRTMHADIDTFVAGYAYILGYEDGREPWDAALTAWYEHGTPPQFKPVEGPAAAFADAIRTEAIRQRHQRGIAPRPSTRASKKKRTGG